MIEPLVSVVIPTYGRNEPLVKAIECVRGQTYANWEIIVVDDNPPDSEQRHKNQSFFSTLEIEKNVHYLQHDKNLGACAARNNGVSHASGKLIAFYDDDDAWYPDKLQKQVTFMANNGLDFSFCWMNEYYGNYRRLVDFSGEPDVYTYLLQKGNGICTSAIIVNTEIVKTHPFDEELQSFQDFDFLLRLAKRFKGAVQKEVLMDYQLSPEGISRNPRKKVQGLEKIIEKFSEQYKEINYVKGLAELYQQQGDFSLLMGLYWPALSSYLKSVRLAPLCLKSWLKLIAGALTGKMMLKAIITRKQQLFWQKITTQSEN